MKYPNNKNEQYILTGGIYAGSKLIDIYKIDKDYFLNVVNDKENSTEDKKHIINYLIRMGDIAITEFEQLANFILQANKYNGCTIQEVYNKDTTNDKNTSNYIRFLVSHPNAPDSPFAKLFLENDEMDYKDYIIHIEDENAKFLYVWEMRYYKRNYCHLPSNEQWEELKNKYDNNALITFIVLGNREGWEHHYTYYENELSKLGENEKYPVIDID